MMRRRTFLLACGLLALAGPAVRAEDKGKPALSGTWVLQGGQMRIEFSGDDGLKLYPHGDSDVVVFVCQYTRDKKGVLQAKITDVEGEKKEQAKAHFPVGTEFRFRWQAKDDVATLDGVKADKDGRLQSHLEGKYDKKK